MIASFRGTYGFLSNFYQLQNPLLFEEDYYETSEHAYQAAKVTDRSVRKVIATKQLNEIKKYCRTLKIREDWDDVRECIMFQILLAKFSPESELTERLIKTFPEVLIEGNTWNDNYWGVDINEHEYIVEDGLCIPSCSYNHLGRLLMTVRDIRRLDKQYELTKGDLF